jgi:hypothetical protein
MAMAQTSSGTFGTRYEQGKLFAAKDAPRKARRSTRTRQTRPRGDLGGGRQYPRARADTGTL